MQELPTANKGQDGATLKAQKSIPSTSMKSLWAFFCVTAACSWMIWLMPVPRGSLYVSLFGWHFDFPFNLIKFVIGNCMPGILALAWTVFEGKQHLHQIISSLAMWKVSPKWYIFAATLPFCVYLISLDLVLFFFPEPRAFPPVKEFFKSLLMTLPFGPLWEEIAWRGYALRKFENRYSAVASALFVGIYWSVWHIPLWLLTLYLNRHIIFVLLIAAVNLVSWSFIFSFLYSRSSRSLPVVILLHSVYVAASSQAGATIANYGLYLIEISAAVSSLVAIFLALRLLKDTSEIEMTTVRVTESEKR